METARKYPPADDAAHAVLPVEIVGRRRVRDPGDMSRWERSEAAADVAAFVERMNEVAKRHEPAETITENVDRTMRVLRDVADWAAEHEPSTAGTGFSVAPSFQRFHERLRADGHDLLVRTYGRPGDHRTVELPVYLERSFGDPDANVYGLEHELSFCMFLVALFKLHRLTGADEPYVVAVLFDRYLDIVDHVIESYRLEPSTTYGCSGLNDYWYVAFLWGSAQMAGNEERHGLSPAAAILDEDAARRHRAEYVFMKCAGAVHRQTDGGRRRRTKGARRRQRPLWFHSYQLWSLTAFPRWDRVNDCLMAAFRRLVLGRFEVVSRLVFGEFLRFTRNPRPPGISFYNCIPPEPVPLSLSTKTASDRTAVDDEIHE